MRINKLIIIYLLAMLSLMFSVKAIAKDYKFIYKFYVTNSPSNLANSSSSIICGGDKIGTQVFYDGTPVPAVLPTQGSLEEMSITTDQIPDNRQGNDIKVDIYKGQLKLRNNIIPAIKGPGIDGAHLAVSYTYASNLFDGTIGWHNNISFEIKTYKTDTNIYYTVSLPDGRLYSFYAIDIPFSGSIIVPASTIEDVQYSKLSYEGPHGLCLQTRNGTRYYFQNRLSDIDLGGYKIVKIQDRLGNAIQYEYGFAIPYEDPRVIKISEYIFNVSSSDNIKPTGRSITISYQKEMLPDHKIRRIESYIDPENRIFIIEKVLDTDGTGLVVFYYPDGTSTIYEMINWRIVKITTPNKDKIIVDYEQDPYALQIEYLDEDFNPYGLPKRYSLYYVSSITDSPASGHTENHVTYFDRIPRDQGYYYYRYMYVKNAIVTDMEGRQYDYEFDFKGRMVKRTIKGTGTMGAVAEESFGWLYKKEEGDRLTAYTDINGVRHTFEYKEGNPVLYTFGVAYPITIKKEFNDAFDIETKMWDPMGRLWENDVDPNYGLIKRTIRPDHTQVEYTYNTNHQLSQFEDENGHVTKYRYNSKGLVEEIENPEGNTTSLKYDDVSNVVEKIDANGNKTVYEYNPMNRITRTVYYTGNSYSAEVVMAYDNNGNLISKTDEAGKKTTFTYNQRNQVTCIIDHLGQKISYGYDAVGNKVSEVDKTGNSSSFSEKNHHTTTYVYDALSRLIEEIDGFGKSMKYGYSGYSGNPLVAGGKALPTEIIDKNGFKSIIEYDEKYRKKREKDAENNLTTYDYDDNSNLATTTDALSRRTEFKYDLLNRKIQTIYPDNHTEFTEYDSAGNVKRIKVEMDHRNQITEFEYNRANMQILRRFFVSNATPYETHFDYDGVGNKTIEIDAQGNSTYFTYDYRNRLIIIKNPLNGTKTFFYNEAGKKISETDEKGNKTTFEYDDLHRLTRTICAEGFKLEEIEYDLNDNIILKRDAENRVAGFQYDRLNRMVKEINALGGEKDYTYDNMGNKKTETDENGHQTMYEYNKVYKPVKITNHKGYYTQNTYDAAYNLIIVRDLRGNITKTEYDELNRPVKLIQPDANGQPNGPVSTTKYDKVGNVIEQVDFNGNKTTYAYDEINRKIRKTDHFGKTIFYKYDQNGNLTYLTDRRGNIYVTTYDELNRKLEEFSPAPFNAYKVAYVYEANGNLSSVTDQNGLKTSYKYDRLNRKEQVIDNRGRVTFFSFDKVGNIIRITDRNGIITEKEYDALNRLKKLKEAVISPNGTAYTITEYDYDAVGNRISITDGNGKVTQFDYDSLNRLTRHYLPDETPDSKADNDFYAYVYDQGLNIIERYTPKGEVITQTYDQMNRLKSKMVSGDTWRYGYDSNGNMTSAVNQNAVYNYSYDELNRLTDTGVTYPGLIAQNKTLSLSYDDNSNLTGINTYSGKNIGYQIDELNRHKLATAHNGFTVSYTYDPGSRLTDETLSNNTYRHHIYDNLNRMISSVHQRAANNEVLNLQNNYDNEANRLFDRIAYHDSFLIQISRVDVYRYDSLYRVTGTKYGINSPPTPGLISETNQPQAPAYDAAIGQDKLQQTVYDKIHNRTSHKTDASVVNYTVNAMNQYTTVNGATFVYDKNGNLINDGVKAYEYDAENRLIRIRNAGDNSMVATYYYDAHGRRIGKRLADGASRIYYYDQDWHLMDEYDENFALVREYTYAAGIDRPITSTARLDRLGIDSFYLGMAAGITEVNCFYHQNGIGNVLALTDNVGDVICRYLYDIHGVVEYLDKDGNKITGNDLNAVKRLNEFLFTGRQIDQESGLYYFRNRYYSHDLGRFITTDPLDYVDGMNLYGYVNGNVVNLVDPMGLEDEENLYEKVNERLREVDSIKQAKKDFDSLKRTLKDKGLDNRDAQKEIYKVAQKYIPGFNELSPVRVDDDNNFTFSLKGININKEKISIGMQGGKGEGYVEYNWVKNKL